MKRRLLALLAFSGLLAPGAFSEERSWFHVRIFHLSPAEPQRLFDRTMAEAIVPAFQRHGIAQLGVFRPVALQAEKEKGVEVPRQRYLITALQSPEQLVTVSEKLVGDSDFLAAAEPYLRVEKEDAVFSRVESSLLYAFAGMPSLVVPKRETDKQRLFELRVYESFSEMKGKRKVEMFNQGEIEVFNAVGLNCLFFGEALVGKNLPQLTYMAVYNDEAHRKVVWDKFLAHPKWDELKTMERYKDTVSKIISQHMQALPYSPIQ